MVRFMARFSGRCALCDEAFTFDKPMERPRIANANVIGIEPPLRVGDRGQDIIACPMCRIAQEADFTVMSYLS